jgi:hypothetical protein
MALEPKNMTNSSTMAVCIGCLLRNYARAMTSVHCGNRVCAAW